MASSRLEQSVLLLLQQDPAMASLLAVALATVILLLVASLSRGSGRRKRLPPSPWSLPVIGHLHLVRPPVHRTFRDLAAQLGPLMHVRLGSTHCVVASSAAVASELIRSHEGKISERPLTAVARQFAYGSDGFAFAPYSPHWRFMKRLCMSELLGPRTVDQLRPIRRAGLVSMLQSVLLASSSSSVVDLTSALIRLSNTSIIRMMASTVPASITDEAQVLVKAVAELVGAFNVEDYIAVCRGWDLQGLGRRAADVHRRFDALMEDMIRHKEEAREARRMREDPAAENNKKAASTPVTGKDLLDILLDKMEDDMAAEVTLTREKIKAFFIDVVTAGSDTSAAMVEWMVAELMNHPECLRKVRAEIDAVVGRDRIAGEGDVASLPYLMAAYKETLRLRPAAPIAHRQSTEEMELVAGGGNFTVPAGTAVFINLWAIGRDPSYWESPQEFRPERFMAGGGNEGMDPRGQNFQYLPFGSGRRGCPGMGLALQSVPGVVAALIQCFDWTVVSGDGEGKQPAVIDMEEADGLVCARKHPLLLRASPRLSPFPAVV
ncbi:cytochrome P450 93G1 [Lolium perenne]|uniref:cytochrome P450 93G1 n=1 Tax=Lolium perenne TaxID=4522 RepID=UPI0021EA3866|nr:cytochrome P450 93G1-like [Lolium perenne]